MCLPPLSQLIHLLNSFLCFFPSYFLDPTMFQYFYMIFLKPSTCIVFIICDNLFHKRTVINLFCTEYLHAYNRLLKMGIISCKNKHPPFSAYNELLSRLIYIWFLRYINIIEWNKCIMFDVNWLKIRYMVVQSNFRLYFFFLSMWDWYKFYMGIKEDNRIYFMQD